MKWNWKSQHFFWKLAFTAAYGGLCEASGGLCEASGGLCEASGGLCEASGGRLASLAYTPHRSLRSPASLWKSSPQKMTKNISVKNCCWRKNLESEKNLKKKNRENFFQNFIFRFSVEIFHVMSRLRMQNFLVIGQGFLALQVRTNGHTEKLF